MVEIKGIAFADNFGVLFALKEKHGLKTIQETYKLLQTSDVDLMLEILNIAYNKAHIGNELGLEQFMEVLYSKDIGFLLIAEIYKQIVEAIMFTGLTPEEIEERKNAALSLLKEHKS